MTGPGKGFDTLNAQSADQVQISNAPKGWLAEFRQPPLKYRPIPFWSWNETMEPDEVRRQCRIIHDAGWGGAFVHARVGLRTPYLGQKWFEACAAAVDECSKLGIKVWLYDEEGWPSGISGGSVPLADESFRHKVLFARPVNAQAPERSVLVGGPQNGLQVYHWTSPLGSWRFNGTCYADLLSRDAMAKFIDEAYKSYHRHFASEYGQTIVAQFLDEPCAVVHVLVPAGAMAYTDCLFDAFIEDHGYDVRPHLHLLFQDGTDAPRIRVHYARTVSRLFEVNFTKQLGDWCDAHGIALTGHYMEGGLYLQQCKGNSIPQNYRHQHIPGIDHLCMQVSEVITAKQCHGVVNQYAKPGMLCETYGAAGQNISFADRWWIGLHLLSLGVTQFNPHLSLFTMAGARKRDFPPNLFFQQPWWPAQTAVEEPLTRLCVALSQGRPLAEALVLHPQESAAALFRVGAEWPEPAGLQNTAVTGDEPRQQINQLDSQFKSVVLSLLGSQRVFDLGDEIVLRDAGRVERQDGRAVLRVGAMTYGVVVMPSMLTLAPWTYRLLREFHEAGGLVLLAGDAPTLVDGRASSELMALTSRWVRVSPAELSVRLAAVATPLVRIESSTDVSDIFVQVRDLPDGDRLVFLADRRRVGAPIDLVTHLAGDFASVHELDPMRGTESPLGSSLAVPLVFHPASAHLLRLSREPLQNAPTARDLPASNQSLQLAIGTWRVERLDDNALVLDRAQWREATFDDFTPEPVPVIAIQGRLDALRYRGPIGLRYSFRVAGLASGRRVHLVVEYAPRYRITVNGAEVQCCGDLPPYLSDIRFDRIDISSLVREGENCIELQLAEFVFADPNAMGERQPDRTGTEIEAIYIVGDFHVTGQSMVDGPDPVTAMAAFSDYSTDGFRPVRVSYLRGDSLAIVEPTALRLGDVVTQGLPFYAGRLRLTTTLPDSPSAAEQTLLLDAFDATVALVEANGQFVGHLFAAPLAISLPPGAREVEVTLYSSLRNLLGPYHHLSGEPVNTAPWFWSPYCGEGEALVENVLAWAHGRFEPSNYRHSYASVSFGQVDGLRLESCKRSI